MHHEQTLTVDSFGLAVKAKARAGEGIG